MSSPEALDRAHEVHPIPNLTYAPASLPELPFPEASLDVLVALEIVEDLQSAGPLVAETRRVLKDDGIFIVSAPDKQAFSNRSKQGLYAAEFRELLGQHFEHVELYRQGAVSGAVILKESDGLSGLSVESVPFAAGPEFGDGPLDTDLILAVCGGTGLPADERPYLLLDRDRRLLDEREDAREDVELLKAEVRQMQETEVRTFHETLAACEAENARLRAREREAQELRHRLDDIERSRVYRLLGTYRRLRTSLDGLVKRVRGR